MNSVPLPIFGTLNPGEMELIKAAKRSLDLPFLVRPLVASPELKGQLRVLSVRARPSYLCDNVLVANLEERSVLRSALAWVLRQTETHHLALTADEMVLPLLRSVLGPNVREVLDDDGEPEPLPEPARRRPKGRQPRPEVDRWAEQGWPTGADFFATA